jgi:hypothetical protein
MAIMALAHYAPDVQHGPQGSNVGEEAVEPVPLLKGSASIAVEVMGAPLVEIDDGF